MELYDSFYLVTSTDLQHFDATQDLETVLHTYSCTYLQSDTSIVLQAWPRKYYPPLHGTVVSHPNRHPTEIFMAVTCHFHMFLQRTSTPVGNACILRGNNFLPCLAVTMMKSAGMNGKIDINIAVLGCEQTGKSTVVNAVCGVEVTEAGFKLERTDTSTECINIFRLVDVQGFAEEKKSGKNTIVDIGDEDNIEEAHLTAQCNAGRKASTQSSSVETREHVIPVNELPITVRPDAQVCIMEWPGLNDRDTARHRQARTSVQDKWESLDVVLLVIDAQFSADHNEQKENLRFVHNLRKTVKNIPCIVVCNKVL